MAPNRGDRMDEMDPAEDSRREADEDLIEELRDAVRAPVAELEAGLISQRTKAALTAAKQRGASLGSWRAGPTVDQRKGVEAIQQRATDFAEQIRPIIAELSATGASSRDIAAELTRRGIRTSRRGNWTVTTVRRVNCGYRRGPDSFRPRGKRDLKPARPGRIQKPPRPCASESGMGRHASQGLFHVSELMSPGCNPCNDVKSITAEGQARGLHLPAAFREDCRMRIWFSHVPAYSRRTDTLFYMTCLVVFVVIGAVLPLFSPFREMRYPGIGVAAISVALILVAALVGRLWARKQGVPFVPVRIAERSSEHGLGKRGRSRTPSLRNSVRVS